MFFGLLGILFWIALRIAQIASMQSLYYWGINLYGELKEGLTDLGLLSVKPTLTFYSFKEGRWLTYPLKTYQMLFYQKGYGQEIEALISWIRGSLLIEALIIISLTIGLSLFIFSRIGKKSIIKKKVRGGSLVKASELKHDIQKSKQASDIVLGSLPLVKGSERQHILLTGTTGTGKTNLLHELLPQIRKRGDRAVVVDVNGSFHNYYKPDYDALLNPLFPESKKWLPWADASEKHEFDALAGALIGEGRGHDPFWEQSAQKIVSVALREKAHEANIEKLLYLLNSMPGAKYARFFKKTEVGALTAEEGDKTVASIRATISSKISSLSYLKETEDPFSMRKFLNDQTETGWLFLSITPKMREALKPLLSCWVEIALSAIMEKDFSQKVSNTWFILDELAAFGKVPSLKTGLAEARKYGGCIVAGVQNTHQISEIYGRESGHNILDQFNTRYIFRVGDEETARQASRLLGEEEIVDTQESLSYGAHAMRDGVNINTRERNRPLVMPSEIMNLEDLFCYVRLAGAWPISKLGFKYQRK